MNRRQQDGFDPAVTRAAEHLRTNRMDFFLLPPLAASFFYNLNHVTRIWRKRVGVEPTFEAREGLERQL